MNSNSELRMRIELEPRSVIIILPKLVNENEIRVDNLLSFSYSNNTLL